MRDGEIHAVVEFIHGLVVDPDLASQTDNELLKRFLANRDEAAFVALVLRHGPMVLALCRRILRDPHDAEDAFQAAFLVFVRKAASIVRPELLGNWLYGVASRTARAARAAAERRRVREAEAVPREQPDQESPWQELQPFLDQELNRLPARYRIPIVLCHLEEMSRHEAARALGLPEGTLSSRLARGRALLAQRLARLCPSVAGEMLLAGLGKQAIASQLVQATTRAGMSVLAGRPINTGVVSSRVALLTEGVLKGMFLTKLKIAACVLCLGSLLACAVGAEASRGFGTVGDSPVPVVTAQSPNDPLMNQVLEATKDITDAQARLRVLLRVASVRDRSGDRAGATNTRREAFELAKGFAAGIPRVDALLMVAQSQTRAKDRTAALETLKQAEQAVAPIEGKSEKPTWLARLVIAQASAGDYEGGLRTLAKGGSFQGNLLGHFGNSLNTEDKEATRKAVTQALALVKFEGESAAIQRINGLSGACYALAKAGALDQALETAAKLMGKEKDRCLEVIVVAQAGAGDIAGATRTAKGIQQDDSKVDALNAIVDAQAKAGDLTAARGTLNEVRKLAETLQRADHAEQARSGGLKRPRVPNPRLDQLQYQIAHTQLQLGDKSGALVTVANIESDLEKANTLRWMGIAQMKAGKPAEARELLLAASQAAQRVVPAVRRGGWPTRSEKATTLSFIAREQASAGDVKEAFRTANTIPTDEAMDDALAGIAPAQAEAGDLKGAVETVARIRDETSKGAALDDLAQVLTRTGREKDALALAARQTSPALKARVLLGVIVGKANAKLPKQEPPR
ncbi:MAG TPA: sigma-70 family RNA polymerase sigma factor [Gemmata sp.]|nr:sigma-70 family RNA polymerase sigma factor [Gemmata sp.]